MISVEEQIKEQFRQREIESHVMMEKTIFKVKLLDSAQARYDSIPRWRIFKKRFAKQVLWSTILLVSEMK